MIRSASSSSSASASSPERYRTATPTHSAEELASFISLVRRAVFEDDHVAARAVDAKVRDLPLGTRAGASGLCLAAHSRAVFIKAQSAVRAEFHSQIEQKAREDLERTMREMSPGTVVQRALSIGPAAGVNAMRSAAAKRERRSHLISFLRAHAHRTMPGPHPFLRTLHAALVCQSKAVEKGGAGRRLVEWTVADAVWSQAAHGFIADGVELMKGVLGFDEAVKPSNASSHLSDDTHSLAESSHTVTRPRAASDPFQDPREPLTPGVISPGVPLLANEPPRPVALDRPEHHGSSRVFTAPAYLQDCELDDLARLWPRWLFETKSSAPVKPELPRRSVDIELGLQIVPVRGGHGELRIGPKPRDPGYRGSLLERLVHRIRHLFG